MTHVTCRLTAKNRDQLRNPPRSVIEYGLRERDSCVRPWSCARGAQPYIGREPGTPRRLPGSGRPTPARAHRVRRAPVEMNSRCARPAPADTRVADRATRRVHGSQGQRIHVANKPTYHFGPLLLHSTVPIRTRGGGILYYHEACRSLHVAKVSGTPLHTVVSAVAPLPISR